MNNKIEWFASLEDKINKRRDDVIERNPHDSEFEAGNEDLEQSLLSSIETFIFSKDLVEIEKTTIGEVIHCLKSITTLLETKGEVVNLRDQSNADVFVEELKSFNLKASICDKIFIEDREESHDPELPYDEDSYIYVNAFTQSGIEIKLKLVQFFYMYSSDVEDYLFQWSFNGEDYKTYSEKEVIRFLLLN